MAVQAAKCLVEIARLGRSETTETVAIPRAPKTFPLLQPCEQTLADLVTLCGWEIAASKPLGSREYPQNPRKYGLLRAITDIGTPTNGSIGWLDDV